jgi:RimJ/RimL family protein N-acetyltransferase
MARGLSTPGSVEALANYPFLPRIVTPRLILRPWTLDDLSGLLDMDTDPEVMRYIGDGSMATPDQVEATLQRFLEPPPRPGLGLIPVEERATGQFLGWAGLSRPRCVPAIMPAVEAGWRLRRSAWGRGIATEAARAAISALLPELDLTEEGGEIVSIRHPDNTASERVMIKLGFTRSHEDVVPQTQQTVIVHRAALDQLVLT